MAYRLRELVLQEDLGSSPSTYVGHLTTAHNLSFWRILCSPLTSEDTTHTVHIHDTNTNAHETAINTHTHT